MSHYIERWECGHVASQCRCPGPKEERTRPGKCSTCAAQVNAMPERVIKAYVSKERIEVPHPNPLIATYVYDGEPRAPDEVEGWIVIAPHSEPPVPESRLLAAEARVREMEEQASRPVPLDYGRHPITDARRDFIHHALTYPGFVGNRDLFVEAARDLAAEAATLRAERDALVELVRDVACSGVAFEDKRLDYVEIQINTDTWAQARAILAREAGE